MPAPVPTILDCDPGHDDALAILLAHNSPAADLRAITTVAGNQTLEKVTLNALRICTLAKIHDVPIAAGADRPMIGPLHVAADVHGESGLDGADFADPEVDVSDATAASTMRQVIADADEPITIVATGPLTNVAHLLADLPDPKASIREIVLMGGSTDRGNTTPYAEFNIHADAEAAAQVFASGVPATMVGLNTTHKALATEAITDRIRRIDGHLAHTIADLLEFFASTYQNLWGLTSPPVHDPVAVARVIDPHIVECVEAPVSVETTGEFTRGATVVDLHRRTGRPPNASVAVGLNVEAFWNLTIDAITQHS